MSIHLRFYQDIIPFSDFKEFTRGEHFHKVPSDWDVIITDLRGSTAAIEAGRYKDVNTIGGAVVACVQNVLGPVEFPYVFGGDGATLLLPGSVRAQALSALNGLVKLAQDQFGLQLRVGVVGVGDLEASGAEVLIGKFQLAGEKSVAVLKGGGVSYAEKLIKDKPEKYLSTNVTLNEPDLTGLSCRWQPIPSRNGSMLSLLAIARGKDPDATYQKLMGDLEHILSGSLDSANPVNLPDMRYRTFFSCLNDESRWQSTFWSWYSIRRLIEVIISMLIFRIKILAKPFRAAQYSASMPQHSDYRKFDDALRMVLDCTPTQVASIQALLARMHRAGEIYYGTHESRTALMTCLVTSLDFGQHIHFIDGSDGGYSSAAKMLKQQMKS